MQLDGGLGRVNILHAEQLMNTPRLYATFMLWLLSELFEELPEMGDLDKPKLVFFFAAGQPGAARATRLYCARSTGAAPRRADISAQSAF